MASIGSELKTYLKTKTAVTDLVGSGTAARIYPHTAKQGVAMPYIVFEIYQGESNEHLGGISGVCQNRIQLDCYAATSDAAYDLAEAVRLVLQMARTTFGSTSVLGVSANVGSEHGFEPPVKGGAQKRYYVSRDYFITYAESISA